MKTLFRDAGALLLATALAWAAPSAALAHAGEGASTGHVIIEMGTWGLSIVTTLAIVVAIFWVRARLIRRSRS